MNQSKFIEEVEKLGIDIDNKKLIQLEKYYELLIEYNEVMNLTAITNHDDVYLKHFYDSLTLAKIIDLNSEKDLCDLGSGAGFPGIVLKIFYPHLHITLVDSLNKRINFLNDVIQTLGLNNIEAIHSRIEDFSGNSAEKYDIVTARAVAPLNVLLELGIKLCRVGKYFIAMKGNMDNEPNCDSAIAKLNCRLVEKKSFKLPIENSNRTLIKIIKTASTPKIFPRKYSEIKKKPL